MITPFCESLQAHFSVPAMPALLSPIESKARLGCRIVFHWPKQLLHRCTVNDMTSLTRCLQDDLRREVGALHLQHTLGQNEVSFPEGCDVRLEATPRRPVVVQSLHPAVNFESRHYKHSPDHEVIHGLGMMVPSACPGAKRTKAAGEVGQ